MHMTALMNLTATEGLGSIRRYEDRLLAQRKRALEPTLRLQRKWYFRAVGLAIAPPSRPQLQILEFHTWFAAVTVGELGCRPFRKRPGWRTKNWHGGAGAALEVDDGALGKIEDFCRRSALQAAGILSCGGLSVSKLMWQNRSAESKHICKYRS